MPSAMPIAAATPIAGAPRITIVLMARATSGAVLQRTYTSWPGSFRWSIITTTSPSRAIVGSISIDCIEFVPELGVGRGLRAVPRGTVRSRPLQQARVERKRQEILLAMTSGFFAQIGEHDLEIAAEFPQDLPTRAARRRGRFRIGDDGDAGEGAMPLGERFEHRDSLGADGQPVRSVLNVAPGDDGAVRGFER